MPVFLFLLLFGLSAVMSGGWVAFDIRGSSAALEAYQERNHELRTTAVGNFTPPDKWITALGYRVLGGSIALAGVFLTLVGVAELVSGG
ncbi:MULTISPECIES: hypothetical protein [unclassified Streptomyces]|uniref:hypothetical protein n=1 Tax=unclassified Streptomyces TaxID=2593676 RepID=UPI002E81329E|nr:hypothetical protein [Streptomyces sp. NBC_00589]WTI36852.1 hypothetical protein OIC96_18480 [Streptomyces sp. NBC_00775]WUB29472.1 hypothetical protein OHA51_31255 [Streptomyces sp. NBC_00589]